MRAKRAFFYTFIAPGIPEVRRLPNATLVFAVLAVTSSMCTALERVKGTAGSPTNTCSVESATAFCSAESVSGIAGPSANIRCVESVRGIAGPSANTRSVESVTGIAGPSANTRCVVRMYG